ncbi:jg22420, partial [Pararge aegeria aegeria]
DFYVFRFLDGHLPWIPPEGLLRCHRAGASARTPHEKSPRARRHRGIQSSQSRKLTRGSFCEGLGSVRRLSGCWWTFGLIIVKSERHDRGKSGPSSSPAKTLYWLCVYVLLGHIVGSDLIIRVVKDMHRS